MDAILNLTDAVARIESKLEAAQDAEPQTRELLRLTIREAVSEALNPIDARLDALERDVARAKTAGAVIAAAVAFLAPVASWLLPRLTVLLSTLAVLSCTTLAGCAALPSDVAELPAGVPEGRTDLRWCELERPVYVVISDAVPAETALTMLSAIEWWAARGVDYLVPVVRPAAEAPRDVPGHREIRVVPSALEEPLLGYTSYRYWPEGCLVSAQIELRIPRLQSGAHELGHALGLGHSEDPWNLMYFGAYPEKDGPWDLTPEQIEAVK